MNANAPHRNDAHTSAKNGFANATRHPLRREMLETLIIRGSMSPAEIARHLQGLRRPKKATPPTLGNVSYHMTILLRDKAVRLVKTKPVRGALEHFYEATLAVCPTCGGHGTTSPERAKELLTDGAG